MNFDEDFYNLVIEEHVARQCTTVSAYNEANRAHLEKHYHDLRKVLGRQMFNDIMARDEASRRFGGWLPEELHAAFALGIEEKDPIIRRMLPMLCVLIDRVRKTNAAEMDEDLAAIARLEKRGKRVLEKAELDLLAAAADDDTE